MANQTNIIMGSLYALFAFFCMAVVGIFTKIALESGSIIWISFITYLTGTLFLLPIIAQKGTRYLQSEHYGLLLGRAIFGTMASFTYTIALKYIPIVNATLLFNTAPLFIPFLAMIFLKDKIKKSIWLAVLIGFIGVIVIIKPTTAIFTDSGNFIGILSGILLATAYLMMKELTNSDPGMRIIFYYLGIGALLQIPLLFFAPFPSWESVVYSIFAGVALLVAQMSLVTAYRFAQASQIGIYQYSSVVFIGLIDWLMWKIIPTSSEVVGTLLVALAGILVIRSGISPRVKS